MAFSLVRWAAFVALIASISWAFAIRSRADTTLATADLQLTFTTSASNFGLQVLDRTNNSVLLTQSALSFGGSAVTGVSSVTNNGTMVTLGLNLAGGGTATATYSALNSDRIRVALTGSGTSVTQSFADQGDRYYGTWMNTYSGSGGTPVNLNNRGIANGKYYGSYGTEGGTTTEGTRAPFYFTNKNVGIYAETTAQGSYDFTSKASFTFDSPALTYNILRADSPKGVLQAVNSVAGGAFIPPLWALDSIWWRDDAHSLQGGATNAQDLILKDAQNLQANHIVAGAIWIDRPYGTGSSGLGGWGNYDFDSSFPNPSQMIQSLKQTYGLNTLLWVANRLSNNQLAEAQSSNGTYKYFSGFTSTPAADVSDPTTAAWFQSKLAIFANLGVKGFKIDRGGEGEMPNSVNNMEAPLFAQLAAQALASVNGTDYFDFARSLSDKTRQYAAVWSGDSFSTFQGLATTVTNGIRAGLTEFPIFGSDTGGYNGTPTEELWDRWIGFSTYTPMMEVLIGPNRTPWYNFSSQAVAISANASQAHHDLIPYVRSELAVSNSTGVPVIRAMFLEFPNDPNPAIADMADQYMYGPNLLVAPVIQAGVTSRSVYLPSGTRWVNFNDKQAVYSGGQTIAAAAPLGTVPVFAREGAIIPHGDISKSNQTTANWTPTLNIDIFPSDAAPSTTFDYYTGSDTRTIAATFVTPYKFEVSFTDLGMNGNLDLYLGRFFAFKAIRSVELDGSPLTAGSGYTFDSIHNLLTAPYTGATDLLLTLVPLPGDFNSDGHVNGADIQAMLAAFADLNGYQSSRGISNADLLAIGDINGDGAVNNADLQALLNLLKSGGGSLAAVPEPATQTLSLLALLLGCILVRIDGMVDLLRN